ncbi:hypothetical protein BG004_002444, partial [Podila humilis]
MSKAPDRLTHVKEKPTTTATTPSRPPLRSSVNVLAQPTQKTPQSSSTLGRTTPSRSTSTTPVQQTPGSIDPSTLHGTTPGYKESTALKSHGSELDPSLLEKIKTLEISIQQHMDIAIKLKSDIAAKRKEAETEQSEFEGRMDEVQQAIDVFKQKSQQSHRRILDNNEELQRRKDLMYSQERSLNTKLVQMGKLEEQMLELEKEKEKVRELQRDTEQEAILELEAEKAHYIKERDECERLLQECKALNNQVEQQYRPDAIEQLKRTFEEREATVMRLEGILAQKKMVTQGDPEDL